MKRGLVETIKEFAQYSESGETSWSRIEGLDSKRQAWEKVITLSNEFCYV